jgi:glycosyltransferase involved in cell wall biosynthesis
VLHILEATLGGTRRHVCDLLRHLDKELFDITFAFSTARADPLFSVELEELKGLGVRMEEIPMVRNPSIFPDVAALWKLSRLIHRGNFDIVHCHSSKAGFLGRLAARITDQHAITLYSPHAIAIRLGRVYWALERFAGYLTDGVVAVSESEALELRGYGIVPEKKIVPITAGIEISGTAQGKSNSGLKRELGLAPDTLLVGSVGRLVAQKDPSAFVAVAAKVSREVPQSRFVWIGDGELREQVVAEIERHCMAGKITLMPFRGDVRQLMNEFDVFLLTSRYESFGYVTCEAMEAGLPVVGTSVPGTIDLVNNETGMLCVPGDIDGLASGLVQLLRDTALRKRMGNCAAERVRLHFNASRMTEEMSQLYVQLVSHKTRAALA